ncbi:MAG: HPF/RaiA family ribosome-associated protein, partial [Acidobacteriota bacterium]
ISDELKRRANRMLDKLAKIASRPQSAEVIFDEDHGAKTVEIVFVLPRGQTKFARAESDDFRTALDRAVDKIRNQLQKETHRRQHGVGGE